MNHRTDIHSDQNPKWTYEDAATLYGIQDWSHGYFAISPKGEVIVRAPLGDNRIEEVPLMEIVSSLEERELTMPVLIRFENIIDARIRALNESFNAAIQASGYQGQFRGAFPVKVNQQSHVIQEIARFGEAYHHGLEVGSKAELLVALSVINDRESVIICNGYKDAEFIDLGLQAVLLGFNCFFVLENPDEIQLILRRSHLMNVEPLIGARIKLTTKVEGHWSKDSGERSLFGLTPSQLVDAVDALKNAGLLHCFKLLHFHLGSQIPNIRNIRSGIMEACRYYVALIREGAPLGFLDIGGGLAVDYDGTSSTNGYSRNYNIHEYCVDIVEAIQESFDQHGIPHPTIISESGRATVAHTAVLLFNILDVNRFEPRDIPGSLSPDTPEPVRNLLEVLGSIHPDAVQECYHDLIHYRDQAQDLFAQGEINLRLRALVENIHLAGLKKIAAILPSLRRIPAELESLTDRLADIYYGNFSVFQSLPDSWAINQIFPIMPIHRLCEEPNRQAVIADITCDCDGKLDNFTLPDGYANTLPLHPFQPEDEYYIGVFLVGAYQETLGDLHNLFGDTNIASIRINEGGSFDVLHEFHGDSIADVLSYVEYEPHALLQAFRQKAEAAVKEGRINVATRQQMLGLFAESLRGYTYFEK